MKLLTKELEKKLPPLYWQEEKEEKFAYIKFFTPWSNWTWYGMEYDPEEKVFFGLVDGLEKEFGYFSLDELESINGPVGLKIERDMYFHPTNIKEL